MFRALIRWWYFRRYGVCPDHFVLCRRGGGYEPKWICPKCDEENRVKHEARMGFNFAARLRALERLKQYEAPR